MLHEVRTNEAGGAGDQDFHGSSSRPRCAPLLEEPADDVSRDLVTWPLSVHGHHGSAERRHHLVVAVRVRLENLRRERVLLPRACGGARSRR